MVDETILNSMEIVLVDETIYFWLYELY